MDGISQKIALNFRYFFQVLGFVLSQAFIFKSALFHQFNEDEEWAREVEGLLLVFRSLSVVAIATSISTAVLMQC